MLGDAIKLLVQILLKVTGIYQAVTAILNLMGLLPTDQTVQGIVTTTQTTLDDVTGIQSSIVAMEANLTLITTDVEDCLTALGNIFADMQFSGQPVTLPTVPPSGYGPLSQTDLFSQVWLTPYASDLDTMYDYAKAGGLINLSLGPTTGYRPDGGIFAYYYTNLDTAGVHPTFYPNQNFSEILAGDTLLTWLTRINSTASCFWWSGQGSAVGVNGNNGDGPAQFVTTITDSDFQAIKANVLGTTLFNSQALWPGLAGVVLGTPTALDLGVTITEPMDGVLISITAVPAKQGNFSFDGILSWRNVGALAFGTDNGDYEFPQTLGFTSAVYTPKAMATAASIVVRTTLGVSGTITPWTIAPVT